MTPKRASRQADEQLLEALYLRDLGWQPKDIATKLGLDASFVRGSLSRIRSDYALSEGGR